MAFGLGAAGLAGLDLGHGVPQAELGKAASGGFGLEFVVEAVSDELRAVDALEFGAFQRRQEEDRFFVLQVLGLLVF